MEGTVTAEGHRRGVNEGIMTTGFRRYSLCHSPLSKKENRLYRV